MKSTLPVDWGGMVELGYRDVIAYAYMGYDSDKYRWPEFIGPEMWAEESN